MNSDHTQRMAVIVHFADLQFELHTSCTASKVATVIQKGSLTIPLEGMTCMKASSITDGVRGGPAF